MTIIKRNKGVQLPFVVSAPVLGNASPSPVLRDYISAKSVRVAGSEHHVTLPTDGDSGRVLDSAEIQKKMAHFQEESRQRMQAEIAQMRVVAQAELQKDLANKKASFAQELAEEKTAVIEEAYAKGFAKGEADAKAQYASAIREVFDTITHISTEKQAFVKNSKEEILALSLHAAQKMMQAELKQDPAALMAIVLDAIRRITDKDRVLIKVNASDMDVVRQYQSLILEHMPDIKSLEVHEDARVEAGGCVIETRLGYVDATVLTKVSVLENAFSKVSEDQ